MLPPWLQTLCPLKFPITDPKSVTDKPFFCISRASCITDRNQFPGLNVRQLCRLPQFVTFDLTTLPLTAPLRSQKMSPLFHPTWLDCSWRRGLLSPDRRLPVGVGSSPLITERFRRKSCCEALRCAAAFFRTAQWNIRVYPLKKEICLPICRRRRELYTHLKFFGGINQFNFWLFWLLPWYSEKEIELCDSSWESDGWRTYSCKNCRTQPFFFSSCRREERAAAVLAGFFPALSLLLTVSFISRRSRFIPAWPCLKCT